MVIQFVGRRPALEDSDATLGTRRRRARGRPSPDSSHWRAPNARYRAPWPRGVCTPYRDVLLTLLPLERPNYNKLIIALSFESSMVLPGMDTEYFITSSPTSALFYDVAR
ncbi:hypothetical protein EVAR_23842_1 [Eumeta japonica]|uniref:Uncharacterized protein n=1 Tax=Eumeta variegata TaxID=151549 RepID=A0A4C1V4K2_EUMVA|nr:hypothetical protein EVAR_23842_1 [Eumeta japonica]